MHAEKILKEMGIELKPVNRHGKSVVPIRRYKDLLYVSGHGPVDENGEPLMQGCVGIDLSEEEGYEAARLCAISMLRTIKDYLGDLDRVEEWIKVLGLVNSGGDFWGMPKVMNGFSDLIVKVFGQRGRHARSAMGAANHELSYPVIVDAIIRIRN
ncbi:MAG: RidA family protein [Clostridiales bacterium]|jgi:enamine deaminase RidA (YjgF/YER057c/UK114 family)|nr:RidA family protein [Clostridiales bacterium]